jgi:hypothetical protein
MEKIEIIIIKLSNKKKMFYGFNKQIATFAASKNISLFPNKSYIKINNKVLQHLIRIGRIGEFCTDIGVIQPCIDLIRNEYTAPNMGYLHMEKRNTHEVQLERFINMFNAFNAFQHHEDWNGEIDLYMLECDDGRPITTKWLPIFEKSQ